MSFMTRRAALLLPFFITACTKAGRRAADVLPPTLEGGWQRGEIRELETFPPLIADAQPAEGVETTYSGQGSVRVRVYRMKAETIAFELMQKWRQADGISAYRGPFFFVAHSEGASPDAVLAVLRELQKLQEVA